MYEEDDTEAVIDLCIADTQLENATVAVRENFIPTVHFAEQSADVTVHNQHTDEGKVCTAYRVNTVYYVYFVSWCVLFPCRLV